MVQLPRACRFPTKQRSHSLASLTESESSSPVRATVNVPADAPAAFRTGQSGVVSRRAAGHPRTSAVISGKNPSVGAAHRSSDTPRLRAPAPADKDQSPPTDTPQSAPTHRQRGHRPERSVRPHILTTARLRSLRRPSNAVQATIAATTRRESGRVTVTPYKAPAASVSHKSRLFPARCQPGASSGGRVVR